MTKNQQSIAAKAFAERWEGKGYEKDVISAIRKILN